MSPLLQDGRHKCRPYCKLPNFKFFERKFKFICHQGLPLLFPQAQRSSSPEGTLLKVQRAAPPRPKSGIFDKRSAPLPSRPKAAPILKPFPVTLYSNCKICAMVMFTQVLVISCIFTGVWIYPSKHVTFVISMCNNFCQFCGNSCQLA